MTWPGDGMSNTALIATLILNAAGLVVWAIGACQGVASARPMRQNRATGPATPSPQPPGRGPFVVTGAR